MTAGNPLLGLVPLTTLAGTSPEQMRAIMDHRRFHQLARAFARGFSRRRLVAMATLFAGGSARDVAASQLSPASCGELGGVCTLSFSCCSGMTCVTSQLNPSYGVCVTGTGGMMAASSGVIAPSVELAQQLAGVVAAQAAAPAVDPQAERDARIAEKKIRKDAKKSRKKSRKVTRKNNRQSRRDGNDRRPDLQLIFLEPTAKRPESVRVRNQDDESVLLTHVESTRQPGTFRSLNVTLAADEIYILSSAIKNPDPEPDADEELVWTEKTVCRETSDGITLNARLSGGTSSFEFSAVCADATDTE
jgi:hypothetical protein